MRRLLPWVWLLAGCGGDAAPAPAPEAPASPDDGSGEIGEGAGEEGEGEPIDDPAGPRPADPVPPAGPAPPVIPSWECPPGFLAVATFDDETQAPPDSLADHHHCRPPPPPDRACPAGLMRRVGEAECVAHGVACPPGRVDWPEEPELRARAPGFDGDVLYVRPRRAVGSGLRDDPFGSIDDALHVAIDGDVIALAPGDYEERFAPEVRVALLGACVEQTALVAPEDQHDVATVDLRFGGGGWLVADLTVTGPSPGLTFRGGPGAGEAGATVRSVRFDRNKLLAMNVGEGPGEATLEGIVVDRTREFEGTWGRALLVLRGGKATVRDIDIHANRHVALGAREPGSVLNVQGGVITSTDSQSNGEGGYALAATSGAQVALRRMWIEDGRSADIVAGSDGAIPGEPTLVELEDVVIRNTRLGDEVWQGWAIYLSAGGVVRGRRLLIDGEGEAIFTGLDRTKLELDELVIKGRTGTIAALSSAAGADNVLRRAIIVGASGTLIEESGPDSPFADPAGTPTRIELEDVAAVGLAGNWALHVTTGGWAILRRVSLTGGSHLAAIHGLHPGTSITLEDVDIDGVGAFDHEHTDQVEFSGLGVWVHYGVDLELDRFRLRGAQAHGMIVGLGGMKLRMADVRIVGLGPDPADPWRGAHGLHVQGDMEAVGERVHVGGFSGFGVLAVGGRGEGSASLELSDLRIDGIERNACRQVGCDNPLGGVGLLMMGDVTIDVRSFAITDAELAGVLVAEGGALTAQSGVLSGNLIGLNVQHQGFVWTDALTDVVFEDNAVDVDSVVAPLPDASEALSASDL